MCLLYLEENLFNENQEFEHVYLSESVLCIALVTARFFKNNDSLIF